MSHNQGFPGYPGQGGYPNQCPNPNMMGQQQQMMQPNPNMMGHYPQNPQYAQRMANPQYPNQYPNQMNPQEMMIFFNFKKIRPRNFLFIILYLQLCK